MVNKSDFVDKNYDIPLTPNASVALIANDTLFYTKDRNAKRAWVFHQLQRQIDLASNWFDKWHLHINPNKTIFIIFGQKHITIEKRIKLKGHYIDWASTAKYLGVTFDRFSTTT